MRKLVCVNASVSRSFSAQKLSACNGFCVEELLPDSKIFRMYGRVEVSKRSFDEMRKVRKVEQCPDDMKIVEKNLDLDEIWEEMR